MAKKTVGAILELIDGKNLGEWSTTTHLPIARNSHLTFTWNKANGWKVQVPTVVTYKDDFNQTRVFHENYAKELLKAYPKLLKFVKEVEEEEFESKPFDGFAEPVSDDSSEGTQVEEKVQKKGK